MTKPAPQKVKRATDHPSAAAVVADGGVRLDRETLAALSRRGGFGWRGLVLAALAGALAAHLLR